MVTRTEQKTMRIITAILAVLIIIPSIYGFGSKLLEFIALVRGDVDGIFAISPVANYLFASTGFFFLLLWATANGMFHDIEAPKFDLLDQEEKLDQHEQQAA
jgi:nitrogen fixation-related uncharacterized protein